MSRGRIGRRLLALLCLSAASIGITDQSGVLSAPPVAEIAVSRSFADSGARKPAASSSAFGSLGRLRLEPADAPQVVAAPATAPAPIDVADVAIAPPPEVFDAPAPAAVPAPPVLRPSKFDGVTPAGGTWAVIIGIDNYPGDRHDLQSAVADADDVNAALAKKGVPASNRLMIRNTQATASTIRASADWLRAHAGPDAVAVFFYAGHVREEGDGVEAIVGADGKTVTDRELAGILSGLRAKQTWIGIAACFGGGFTELVGPGRVLTAAAPAGVVAYENSRFRRSYLVEYLVRRAMLEERAPGSIERSFAWAKAEIEREHPNRVPVMLDGDAAEVEIRPAGSSSSAPPSGGSSSPPPSGTSGGSSGSGGSAGSGGSNPPPSQPQPEPEPEYDATQPGENDGCSKLTVGIVRCKG